jgi:hypothetical protein
MGLTAFFPEVMRPGREYDLLPSVRVKNEGIYTSKSSVFYFFYYFYFNEYKLHCFPNIELGLNNFVLSKKKVF